MNSTAILQLEHVSKGFLSSSQNLQVLSDVSLSLSAGDTCALVGPSGSGKSTLLSLAAGLDEADSGSVSILGKNLSDLSQSERTRMRRDHLGFVFQNYELIPSLRAYENVMIPLELQKAPHPKDKALEILSNVGLADRATHYPWQLSGGEQQRVALARAYVHRPSLLFADEPTGSLDRNTSESVMDLLFELNKSHSTALLIATHNLHLAERADRIFDLEQSSLNDSEKTKNQENA